MNGCIIKFLLISVLSVLKLFLMSDISLYFFDLKNLNASLSFKRFYILFDIHFILCVDRYR